MNASPSQVEADLVIIGAGMAGASLAYEASRAGLRCVVLERESQPGYHTTGRSAALYAPLYGNRPVRALTRASRAFYDAPGEGFADHPLLVTRPSLFYARGDQREAVQAFLDEMGPDSQLKHLRGANRVREEVPVLRDEAACEGVLDESSSDIDVAALLQGYLKAARALGAQMHFRIDLSEADIRRSVRGWEIHQPGLAVQAARLAVCAGAWADTLAPILGAQPPGIEPKRRTALVFEAGSGSLPAHMPMAINIIEDLYFRPEAGRILLSPADETPSPPCDAQPEELDVAIAIDRLGRDTHLEVRRITARWAGLRSFAADRAPVAGFDPQVPDLYWLVGQGGYGIQMAPALAQWCAAELAGKPAPAAILDEGLEPAQISPARPRQAKAQG